jgi:hypothetical protein
VAPVPTPDVLPVFGLPGVQPAAVTAGQHGAGSPAGPITAVVLLLVVLAGISIVKPRNRSGTDDDPVA